MEECLKHVSEKSLDDEGTFHCPACGNIINPEDFSDENYRIENTLFDVTKNVLVVIIHCQCGTRLFLKLPIPDVFCVYEETVLVETVKDGKEKSLQQN